MLMGRMSDRGKNWRKDVNQKLLIEKVVDSLTDLKILLAGNDLTYLVGVPLVVLLILMGL